MIVGCPFCLVRRVSSTIALKDISSYTTGWILTKLGRNEAYTKVLMGNGSLMEVIGVAECSKGSILQYF